MTKNCKIDCDKCPLNIYGDCVRQEIFHTKGAIAIVQQWSDEHPPRTYLDDFTEKFPTCKDMTSFKYPKCCRNNLYGISRACPESRNCEECWNEVMEDENENP